MIESHAEIRPRLAVISFAVRERSSVHDAIDYDDHDLVPYTLYDNVLRHLIVGNEEIAPRWKRGRDLYQKRSTPRLCKLW